MESNLKQRYGENALVGVFDSMDELMAAAQASHARTYWDTRASAYGCDWFGLDADLPPRAQTVAGVRALLASGWTRGARRLTEALANLGDVAARPRSVLRRNRWEDQGDSLDIHRVYAGQLSTAWQRCRRESRTGPQRVTLVCDAVESGSASAETMFWRGAAIVALADKLTTAGYAVEVVSAWHGTHTHDVVCYVVVKSHRAPLDVTTLASAVACPAFFRCFGHSWGNSVDGHTGGYGVWSWTAGPGEIVATHDRTWTAAAARAWIAEQIAKLEQQAEAA